MQLSVTEVLKFLHSLKPKGFSYSIMNSARFALSAFSTLEVIKATKVCKYSVCKCYIGLPRNIRGDQTELFITTTKTIPQGFQGHIVKMGKRNAERGKY